jgi:probable HAF family extracellular repeat protein
MKRLLLMVGVALLGASGSANAQLMYSVSFLFGPDGGSSAAFGINNLGQIVGSSTGASITIWDGALTPRPLSTTGGASGINDAGKVVGNTGDWPNIHATAWVGTTATDLGTLGGSRSFAYGVNNSGLVVGAATTAEDAANHATIWNGTNATDLGTLGGISSFAYGVNDSGRVVGEACLAADAACHATIWIDTAATDLGTLGGNGSVARAVNNLGQVVGEADITGNSTYLAAIWRSANGGPYVITELSSLGWGYGSARAVNNIGQVVGRAYASDSEFHAAIWNDSVIADLNVGLDPTAVDAGWLLTDALGINDLGQIVGNATNRTTGVTAGFLLTPTAPVPEPETYVLMLAGLAVLGAAAKRRKTSVVQG